jgi:protein PhnA
MEKKLFARCGSICELCAASDNLKVYKIAESHQDMLDAHIVICPVCRKQIEEPDHSNPNHWHCLNDSVWSEVRGVKVVAWRMLSRLSGEGWPQDLLDLLYLDEDTMKWAKAAAEGADSNDQIKHIDSNGVQLNPGDSVLLIKDLRVMGAGFTAKRGKAVRNISLVADNPEQIEVRVNGQHIILLTKFVKKS